MPRPSLIAAAVSLALLSFAPPALSQSGMRVEEAVRLALTRSERSRQARLRVDAAEGSLERARAAFLPSLTASGQVQGSVPTQTRGGVEEPTWTPSATLTLTQPLVTPTAWPQYAQARHSLDAERAGSIDDRQALVHDTAKAFLQALAAEQVLTAARSRFDRAKANLDDARARADAGLASTNDATRVELDVASAASNVAQQEGSVQRAYLELGLVIGADVRGPLAPPSGAAQIDALLAQGADPLVRSAAERRADVRELDAKADAASSAADEPYYRLAPTLSVSAQGRALPEAQAPSPVVEGTLTFNLSWTIYDGGARYGDMRTREAQAESARLAARLAKRGAMTDVRAAVVAFETAKKALRIAEDGVAAAQKNLDETTVLYRQGLARALELTDANGRRFDAEVTRVSAMLALEQACVDLRFALGLDPVEGARVQEGGQ